MVCPGGEWPSSVHLSVSSPASQPARVSSQLWDLGRVEPSVSQASVYKEPPGRLPAPRSLSTAPRLPSLHRCRPPALAPSRGLQHTPGVSVLPLHACSPSQVSGWPFFEGFCIMGVKPQGHSAQDFFA